nr:FecR family protein [Thermoanaerobaculia bacterium]
TRQRPGRSFWLRALPLAATLLIAAGTASWLWWGDRAQADLVQVAEINGQLFSVAGDAGTALLPGARVAENQAVRTGKGSGAVLRLHDGSEIELAERSEVAVGERGGETTIRVHRGSIIVQAAKQHGHLYVATNDCKVAVTGTIFSVSNGTKGSRVSVVEGEVHVSEGSQQHILHSGDQIATHHGLVARSVADEISWSRNHDRYIALMRELKTLDEEFERTLAAKGQRYSSELVGLMPAGTIAYVAVPNVATEVADLERRFTERLAENPLLSSWWSNRHGTGDLQAKLTDTFEHLSRLGSFLGDEVSLGLTPGPNGSPQGFLLLAGLAQPQGFNEALAQEVEALNQQAAPVHFSIVRSPAEATGGEHEVYLWRSGQLIAVSASPALLRDLATTLEAPDQNPFRQTPLFARIEDAYRQGVQWLGAVDVATLASHLGSSTEGERARAFAGLDNVQQLVIERESDASAVHTAAELSFDGPRQGLASWLAEPAAMGSLDFISADANLAAAFVVESPAGILDQVLSFAQSVDSNFHSGAGRPDFQQALSWSQDLASALGGEIAFALDGPALPSPAWKVVAEVYDPSQLQAVIERLVAEAARRATDAGHPAPSIVESTEGGRRYYEVRFGDRPVAAYTYDSGYLVAAPTRALLDRALQIRASGYSLPDSPSFRALVPQDGFDNFSAVAWTSLGTLGQTLARATSSSLSQEQQRALGELNLDHPTLTCAYAEPERIRLVSTGQ